VVYRSPFRRLDRLSGMSVRSVSFVTVLMLAAACSSKPGVSYVRLSGPMPAISGQTLTGGRVEPSDYRHKVVVVNFWNQDCPPCRREMPLLQNESRRLEAQGVKVIGVLYVGGNWPNDPDAARDFLARLGITYLNVLDRSSQLAGRFGIAGIPSTIVADRSGQMRFRVLGRLHQGQLEELLSILEEE
jgi:thiol-disulfide isomerase/thioredoxin